MVAIHGNATTNERNSIQLNIFNVNCCICSIFSFIFIPQNNKKNQLNLMQMEWNSKKNYIHVIWQKKCSFIYTTRCEMYQKKIEKYVLHCHFLSTPCHLHYRTFAAMQTNDRFQILLMTENVNNWKQNIVQNSSSSSSNSNKWRKFVIVVIIIIKFSILHHTYSPQKLLCADVC